MVSGASDSVLRDTVKGMVPGHICIVQVGFTEVWFSKICFVQDT
jgi:hypothetical protein